MSRRPTNAKPPVAVVDPQIQIIQNLRVGVEWANQLGKMLNTTEAGEWDQRKMVIAALTYAAAMANETQLDEDDWMELAWTAFRGVTVE